MRAGSAAGTAVYRGTDVRAMFSIDGEEDEEGAEDAAGGEGADDDVGNQHKPGKKGGADLDLAGAILRHTSKVCVGVGVCVCVCVCVCVINFV